jgi:hypothetical protein
MTRQLFALAAAAGSSCLAQTIPPSPSAARDILPEISAARLREYDQKLVSFGTRHTLSDPTSDTHGVGAARRWIKSQLESFNKDEGAGPGKLEVSFEEFTAPKGRRIAAPTPTANVIAILPGTMPEAAGRRYYVMGHYDSIPSPHYNPATDDAGFVNDPETDAPGANDDASGTIAVLEIARVLAHHPLESTVVFLCTVGEEQGLIGAEYHAKKAAAEKEDIRAVLNNDIIGDPLGPMSDPARATPGLVRVFSEGLPRSLPAEKLADMRRLSSEGDSPSRELARYIVDVAKKENTTVQPMLVFRQDRFLRSGDHAAFNEAGFAAVRFTEVSENYNHQHQTPRVENAPDGKPVQYGDLIDFVDFDYVANVARLNAATLINLANAPSSPGNVRIITAKLETTTTLRWGESPEPDVAGYEVVWRETTSPMWEQVKDVGAANEVTLDENKDNLFFGVRAYDKSGYRSPVSVAGADRK